MSRRDMRHSFFEQGTTAPEVEEIELTTSSVLATVYAPVDKLLNSVAKMCAVRPSAAHEHTRKLLEGLCAEVRKILLTESAPQSKDDQQDSLSLSRG